MSSTGEEPQPQIPPTRPVEPLPQAQVTSQPQAQVTSQPQAQGQLDPIDEDVDWDQLCEEAAEVARQEEEDEENAIRQLDEYEHLEQQIRDFEEDEEWERLCHEAADIAEQEEESEDIRQQNELEQLEQDHIKYLIDRFQDEEEEEKTYRWRKSIVILISLGLLGYTVSPLFAAIIPIINILQEKEHIIIDPNYKTD
jgi:flagellar biosynthesis GTPase FlhF